MASLIIWAVLALVVFYGTNVFYAYLQAMLGQLKGIKVKAIGIGYFGGRFGWRRQGKYWEWRFGPWIISSYTEFQRRYDDGDLGDSSLSGKEDGTLFTSPASGDFESASPLVRLSVLLIGPASTILLGCGLLLVPVVGQASQLQLVSQEENEFKYVAVTGLRLTDAATTFRGQLDLARDVGLNLGKRIFFLVPQEGWGGFVGAFVTCGASGRNSVYAWCTCVGTILLLLGLLNLLPWPTMNGWHIVLLLVELVSGRPHNDKFVLWSGCLGFAMVVAITLRLVWLDATWMWNILF